MRHQSQASGCLQAPKPETPIRVFADLLLDVGTHHHERGSATNGIQAHACKHTHTSSHRGSVAWLKHICMHMTIHGLKAVCTHAVRDDQGRQIEIRGVFDAVMPTIISQLHNNNVRVKDETARALL